MRAGDPVLPDSVIRDRAEFLLLAPQLAEELRPQTRGIFWQSAHNNQCVSDARHQRSCLPISLQSDTYLAVSVLHYGCGIATAELEKAV